MEDTLQSLTEKFYVAYNMYFNCIYVFCYTLRYLLYFLLIFSTSQQLLSILNPVMNIQLLTSILGVCLITFKMTEVNTICTITFYCFPYFLDFMSALVSPFTSQYQLHGGTLCLYPLYIKTFKNIPTKQNFHQFKLLPSLEKAV